MLNKNTSSVTATQLAHTFNPAFDDAAVSLMAEKVNQFSGACLYNFDDITDFKDVLYPLDYASIPDAVTRTRKALNLRETDDISIKQLSHLLLGLGVVAIPVGWGKAELGETDPRSSMLLQNHDGVFQWCYVNVNLCESSVKVELAKSIAHMLAELPKGESSTKNYLQIIEDFALQLVMPERTFAEIYKQVMSKKTRKKRALTLYQICVNKQISLANVWMRMNILVTRNRMKYLDCFRELLLLDEQVETDDSFTPLFHLNDYVELKELSVNVFGSYFFHVVDSEVENMPLLEQFDFINTLTGMRLMGNLH